MLTGTSREILRHARDLVKDLKADSKNLNQVASVFESYQKSKTNSMSLRTEIEQELYSNYSMALGIYNFEINDFVKVMYWLQKSNFIITSHQTNKLIDAITTSSKFLTSESWFMLLNILTTHKHCFNEYIYHFIFQSLEKFTPPSDDWLIQALLDLCYLGRYDEKLWKKLISCSTGSHSNHIDKLRIIKYAVATEGFNTLGKVIQLALELMIDDAQTKVKQELEKPSNMNLGMLSINKMHREVDFILKNLLEYQVNANIDDTYIVDFYNFKLNLGFDLNGPSHFLTHDIMEKQDILDEDYLIPAIKLKHHLIKKNKYQLGSISFVEWNRFVDQTEKTIFLKRKLRLLKFK